MLEFKTQEVIVWIAGGLLGILTWLLGVSLQSLASKVVSTGEKLDASVHQLTVTLAEVLEWKKSSDRAQEALLRRVERLEERKS